MSTGCADRPPWLRLLEALASGAWVSGPRLASTLGIAPAAVAGALAALETRGLAVERCRTRGYRLARPPELLDVTGLGQALAAAGFTGACVVLPEVPSTNEWLRRRMAAGGAPRACLAEHQTAGRGRRGRGWASAPARNIALSVRWRFASGPSALGGLSLAVGVAVARALEGFGALIGLKWPNDLVIGAAKLGGILIDVEGRPGGPVDAVIGVGVNLEQPPDRGIHQAFVDLATVLGARPPRNAAAAAIMLASLSTCRRFAERGLEPFLPGWQRRDVLFGRPVRVAGLGRPVAGLARGVDGAGRLQVEIDGALEALDGGEVSVRPAGVP